MAKEKKRTLDELEKKETLFYYEMLGVLLIIFSLITLGKLGKVGNILTTATKVLFGDWYWLLLLFILFLGIYNLFVHKRFDFKNQRFIGFLFIYIVLIIFSHFSIHKYVLTKENGYISNTWNLYKSFLNGNKYSFLGGGIIGGSFFYLGFYLLETPGVIIIGVLLLILGFSLIINKPLNEIFKFIWYRIRNIKKYTGNFNSFFKYELGKNKKEAKLKINLKSLCHYDNNININKQIDRTNEIKRIIISLLNIDSDSNNIKNITNNIIVFNTYLFTTIKINILGNIDCYKFITKLKTLIDEDLMYGYNKRKIILHIVNKYKSLLSIKEILEKQLYNSNNYLIPLGINDENNLIELDLSSCNNLLLISSFKETLIDYFIYIFIALLVKNRNEDFNIVLYSNDTSYNNIVDDNIIKNYLSFDKVLYDVIQEIKTREQELMNLKYYSFKEYEINSKAIENDLKIIKKVIFIDCIWDYINEEVINMILYINQMSQKVGLYVIFSIDEAFSNLITIFKNTLVFKLNDINKSINIFRNDKAFYLIEENDCFYIKDNNNFRLQTPNITNDEKNILKRK